MLTVLLDPSKLQAQPPARNAGRQARAGVMPIILVSAMLSTHMGLRLENPWNSANDKDAKVYLNPSIVSEAPSDRVAAQQQAANQRLQARSLCLLRFGHTPQIAKQHPQHPSLGIVSAMGVETLHCDSVCTIV